MFGQVKAFAAPAYGAVILALVAVIVALSLYVWGLHIGPLGFDGVVEKLETARSDLKSARDALAEQSRLSRQRQSETKKRIETVGRESPEARRIEKLPIRGDCKTPSEILESDKL